MPAERRMAQPRNGAARNDSEAPSKATRRAGTGKKRVVVKYVEDDSRRHATFSKRKLGLMKKAFELATLTGSDVMVLVASPSKSVYAYSTPSLAPMIHDKGAQDRLRECLGAATETGVTVEDGA